MKLTHFLVAGTAFVSASAFAGGNQADKGSSSQGSSQMMEQSQGAQSPEVVKQVQEKLSANGHDAGAADGKLGPQTKQALKEFQSSNGLEASGQLDRRTLAALEIDPQGTDAGGSATGGSASGGSASGGSASGGSASDGSATGGSATEGTSPSRSQ